jgi:hypothetical protein
MTNAKQLERSVIAFGHLHVVVRHVPKCCAPPDRCSWRMA